jgi:hypothetical protein
MRREDGMWLCHCTCGTERGVRAKDLTLGKSTSCGCISREKTGARRRTHGMSSTPEYNVYRAMVNRCENPKFANFDRYGGRGIKVCLRWRESFAAFLEDMGPRPPKPLGVKRFYSVERRNTDGDYDPGNCYWATPTQQSRNTSRNRYLTFNGRTLTVRDWATEIGLNFTTLKNRIATGWPVERALTVPAGGA